MLVQLVLRVEGRVACRTAIAEPSGAPEPLFIYILG